jgi:predicted transcriptional regulator
MSSKRQPLHGKLSRRESQIMNAVYRRGRATAKEIRASLPDPPTDSSVRVLLRILEEKGHLKHERDGRRYVYLPTVPASKAGYSELRQLKTTFFRDSVPSVVAALLSMSKSDLSYEDLDELSKLIDDAKK